MTEMTKEWAVNKVAGYGLRTDYPDLVYLATILLKHERRAEEIDKLRADLKSKDGECNFLYSHLVNIISQITQAPKRTMGAYKVYTPQMDAEHIDILYNELNVFSAQFLEVDR